MDEQVKARLIGATVLVVIAVVLVPQLLSGPRRHTGDGVSTAGNRGTRTVTIDLSGGNGEGKAQRLPTPAADSKDTRLPTVAPPGVTAPVQEETPAAADVPDETVAPVVAPARTVQAGAPAPPPVAKPAATEAGSVSSSGTSGTAQATRDGWAVQVGAFGSIATARKLVADLQRDGYSAYITPLPRSGRTLHRVRVGPQPNKADAEKLAARLKAKGLPASVVPAD